MKLANARLPEELANTKYSSLAASIMKLDGLYAELSAMDLSKEDLKDIDEEKKILQEKMIEAAEEYAEASLQATKDIMKLKMEQAQTSISQTIESPVDFAKSSVTTFPLSFDSMKFDVQYFQNDTNESASESHAEQVSSHVFESLSGATAKSSAESAAGSAHKTTAIQTSKHKIEGTMVITASCTQQQAEIIDPLILDPILAVKAWNHSFPDDILEVKPQPLFEAAGFGRQNRDGSKSEEKNLLHILSGCTKGSSFVGMVHFLNKEDTSSSQDLESVAGAVSAKLEYDLWLEASSGNFASNKSSSKLVEDLLSTSELDTHCTIICEGIIPSIVSSEFLTGVYSMKADPAEIMNQQNAILESTTGGVNASMESLIEGGRSGQKFMDLNSGHLQNSVSALEEYDKEANKVIDTKSLLTAFTDFVTQAMEGGCGVPINYYIKELDKEAVAKCYVRKFLPNGALSMEDKRKGMLGQSAEDEEEE